MTFFMDDYTTTPSKGIVYIPGEKKRVNKGALEVLKSVLYARESELKATKENSHLPEADKQEKIYRLEGIIKNLKQTIAGMSGGIAGNSTNQR